jgi:hypothetical protein
MKLYTNGIPWGAGSHGLNPRPAKRDAEKLAKHARTMAGLRRTSRDAVRVPFRVAIDTGMELHGYYPRQHYTERALLGYVDYVEAHPSDAQRAEWRRIADEAGVHRGAARAARTLRGDGGVSTVTCAEVETAIASLTNQQIRGEEK